MKSGRVVSLNLIVNSRQNGPVAQLGERLAGSQQVAGSIPVRSTISFLNEYRCPNSLLDQKDFLINLRKRQRPEANLLKALANQVNRRRSPQGAT